MLQIRTEDKDDYAAVFQLNVAAFENREYEARLVETIRKSGGFIPELSLVAQEDDLLVGHALFSKAELVDGTHSREVIALAPIAVVPERQRQGIGGRLIREGLRRCADMGYELVFLIGYPTYYPRFGFEPARALGFRLRQFDVPDEVFMVCRLQRDTKIKGELIYPEAFL